MRIAIDTNVLIAAVTRPGGTSARIVQTWLDARLEVVASTATIREVELVLGAGWLARMVSPEVIEVLLEALRTGSVVIAHRAPGEGGGSRARDVSARLAPPGTVRAARPAAALALSHRSPGVPAGARICGRGVRYACGVRAPSRGNRRSVIGDCKPPG